jgi:hypothetical protein
MPEPTAANVIDLNTVAEIVQYAIQFGRIYRKRLPGAKRY